MDAEQTNNKQPVHYSSTKAFDDNPLLTYSTLTMLMLALFTGFVIRWLFQKRIAKMFKISAKTTTDSVKKLGGGNDEGDDDDISGSKKTNGASGGVMQMLLLQTKSGHPTTNTILNLPKPVKSPVGQPATTHYLKKPSPTAISPPSATPVNNAFTDADESEATDKNNSHSTVDNNCQSVNNSQKVEQNGIVCKTDNLVDGHLSSSTAPPVSVESGLGQLFFTIRYKQECSVLMVTIVKCLNLASSKGAAGGCDPYVKLQLVPDKQHKVKTRVLRKTRNPIYDEEFSFYGIQLQDIPMITLHFVVLTFDRYSRDEIIGQLFFPLTTIDLINHDNRSLAFQQNIQPRGLKMRNEGRGEMLVSLCWQPAANRLTVVILKARNLPKMDVTGLADPYVKIYLMYKGQRIAKKKTHVKKRTLNPVFNESFVFEIPHDSLLQHVSLQFLLLDWDRMTKNEVIGRLEIGETGDDSSTDNHWKKVCNSARRQIADWHKLVA